MVYNKIHDQYRLGLGLYFTLRFNHVSFTGGWLCLSNIPDMNFRKLESANKEDAVEEAMVLIRTALWK